MLKTISPLISPELLKVLAEMGHGDEIIFRCPFPGAQHGAAGDPRRWPASQRSAAGDYPAVRIDSYAPPVVMMAAVEGDALDPTVEQRYRQALCAGPCPDIAD